MDDEKVKAWIEFLDSLAPDEGSAFLSRLHQVTVKARQKIFRQGECDDRLLFIDSGNLKLSYWNNSTKKNKVFAHLGKGDIGGSDTFFSHSPHTISLTTIEDSMIRCLYKRDYINIISEHPAFENKLAKYCEKIQKKLVFKDSKESGRRAHQRRSTFLKGRIQKIESGGKFLPQVLPVTILNVSVGGLGCSAEKLTIADAEGLYQARVQVTFTYSMNSLPCEIVKKAKVVSVHFVQFGASKIHLQFTDPLPESIIFEITRFDSIL